MGTLRKLGVFIETFVTSGNIMNMTKINCNFKKEKNGNAKLSDAQTEQLREDWKSGEWTLRSLADQYGISHSQVRRIVLKIQR